MPVPMPVPPPGLPLAPRRAGSFPRPETAVRCPAALLLVPLLALGACRVERGRVGAGSGAPGAVAYLGPGGLWVRALGGGEARRVAAGADLVEPRWAPSGRKIAVRKGDGLEIVELDGGRTRPVAAVGVDAFSWAHASDRLAYVSSGALHVVAPDGADRRLVGGTPGGGVDGVAWSPDDRWLAFALRTVRAPDSAAVGPATSAAPDGAPRRPRAPRPTAPVAPRPTAPPPGDGASGGAAGAAGAADPSGAGLWKVPSAGGRPVPVAGASAVGGEPIVRGWTGDGARILYLRPAGDLRSSSLLADGAPLYAVPAAGGTPVELAPAVLPYRDFVIPAPTPDDRVAVVAGRGRETWRDKTLEVVHAASGSARRLTPPGRAATHPAWAPAGDVLAWAGMPADSTLPPAADLASRLEARRILRAPAAGGVPARLTRAPRGREEAPAWSGDGRTLLFVRVDTLGQASLWTIPAGGGTAVRRVAALGRPAGTPAPRWTGAYGHVAWGDVFSWNERAGARARPR